MKNNIINKYFFLFLILGGLLAGFSSCTDDPNDWGTDDEYDRLFRPISLEATVDGADVTLKFYNTYESPDSYTLELSEDSLQFSNIVFTQTGLTAVKGDASSYSYKITGFTFKQKSQYSARLKAVKDGVAESKWSTVAFKTGTEQIMLAVDPDQLKSTSVLLEWTVPNEVTHFILDSELGSKKYDISGNEKTSGQKQITDLTPGVEYTATLYNGELIRGTRTFVTPDQIPEGDNVIVLKANDDLATILASAAEGSIIVFLKDSHYDLKDNTLLPKDITFWGQGTATKPVLSMNGLKLPATGGIIKFENMDITGYTDNDPVGGKKQNYIFNQSDASETQEVTFKSCIIRNLVNTPFRLQGSNAINIGKLTFDNCIAYDCGDNNANGSYAFIHTNVATGVIKNIEVTNSTLYNIGYGLILHNGAPSESVLIENCTFYNVVGNGRLFIDYNAQSAGTFSLRNNILAKTLSPAETAKGIRAANKPIVVNSYKTADFVITGNAIEGIEEYSGTSTDLFGNPSNADFTIIDNSFDGKSDAGDPRWRR